MKHILTYIFLLVLPVLSFSQVSESFGGRFIVTSKANPLPASDKFAVTGIFKHPRANYTADSIQLGDIFVDCNCNAFTVDSIYSVTGNIIELRVNPQDTTVNLIPSCTGGIIRINSPPNGTYTFPANIPPEIMDCFLNYNFQALSGLDSIYLSNDTLYIVTPTDTFGVYIPTPYLNNLPDVDTTALQVDDLLRWDGTDWVPVDPGNILSNSVYNLLPIQDVEIDPNTNDLKIGSWADGNSGDFEFFTTNENGQYVGIFAGTRDSSWLATGEGFQFDAALFSTGAEDGIMGVGYNYFGTVWNAATFGDSILFAPYPGSELNMTINGLPDDPVNPYKVMVQDTVTDRVYLTSIDSLLGSGTAGTLPIWNADGTLGNSSLTEAFGVISSSLTGAFKLPAGTDAQDPVWSAGMLRYNTTAKGIQGYNGTAEMFFPWADADNWVANRIPYSDGNKLTTSTGLVFDASVNELRINTADADMGVEKLQVNGSAVFGTPAGDRIIIKGSSGEIYTPIWGDNLRLGARNSVATSYIDVRGSGRIDIVAQDNDIGDGVYIKNDGGVGEVYFDLVSNRIDLNGNYTIRGATSNHVTLMGGDAYCTGCTSPGPRGYDVYIRGGNGNPMSNRRGFGGDVFIQAYDSMAVVHTLMQFMPDNFTILTPKVIEPTTSWDWVYVMDSDSMRKVTPADIVAAGSGSINSIYNLLPTQDILIDPNANDLIIGSFGAGNSGDFEFFTTNEDGQYAGIFAGTRDSSWLATAGDGFQFDAALFSTGAEDGIMGVGYNYFGTVWNAATFGDSILFAPYPGSELNMTINGLPDDPVNPYKVMVQDTVTDRVYLTSIALSTSNDSLTISGGNSVKLPITELLRDSVTTTTMTIDLETRYQKIVQIDMTSATNLTLTINNPTDAGVYTFHFLGVSGTDNVTWPAAFYDANNTALGTDALTSGTMYTCYYSSADVKYFCK